MMKDKRDKLWAKLELEIQSRVKHKDRTFKLTGVWKKYLRTQSGYKIYIVDGKWIRNNLSVYFDHGGHAYVYEFIPKGEIWISSHHYKESKNEVSRCSCKIKSNTQKISKAFLESTIVHEITECELMKRGMKYWPAHQKALQKERDIGLLRDPYEDL